MKQLATSNLEFQQSVSSSNMQFQQNMTATNQDLKTQIGQLANTMSQLESTGSSNLPSQTILNSRGNASAVTLRSGKELPQPTLQQMLRLVKADFGPNADLQFWPERAIPLPFPSRTISARQPESNEELLKMFRKVEINIPLLDAIKQVPKYAKFLKELCVHKRRKIKGSKEIGGVVSALTRNEEFTTGAPTLPKKCKDPGIFSVPCTIGECTFADAMLDLGASINVMPASIYRSLNCGDLEPIGMTIQLANRSIVQPLGVLEDVLVQVNELIFPADFYVLDMEDETSGKESTLILGRPFLMTARTKIDVYFGTLSMEFGDTLVQFNIFEAMKHPTEDHSLFGIVLLDKIVEEYIQLNTSSEDIEKFVGSADGISYLGVVYEEADHEEVQDLPNFEDDHSDITNLNFKVELFELLDQVYNQEHLECTKDATIKVAETEESPIAQLATIFMAEINPVTKKSPLPTPPMELKPLPSHLKYAYLDKEQQLLVIIANNLHQEQEDKLLEVLRQHKKAIGWKLADLPGINPSICMHRILMEEEVKLIRQQQRRLNPTLLDVVKKEVTKLLVAGIIYPISDMIPKKSGMTVMKNQQDKLVPTRIQNSWRSRPSQIVSAKIISTLSLPRSTRPVSRSSTDPLYVFDPEIELTLRRLRKIRNTTVNISSGVNSAINSDQFCTDHFITSTNNFTEPGQMENQDRTLKELATPDVVYQPWCIQYPQLEPAQTYELKSGLIHLLPKFHGLAGEDPHKHLKEFHVVCSTMWLQGIPEDYIKMKAFPFSLDGAAKDWLYLQPTLFNTWGDMKRTFLEKNFPASRTATIRKEICGIRQHTGETLHEYWELSNC
ncbi:hypothetical protein CR513_18515, partial [Mucuna pruriens]